MNIDKTRDKKFKFDSFSREGHIIDNVPYVSQENNIFCSHACHTMIFKNHEININLTDLVFNSGIGYSLSYSKEILKYFPMSGTILSQWPLDRRFVAGLYGLEYETWIPTDFSSSIYETWNVYWKKIKEHILNDIPVSTAVDILSFPSTMNLLDFNLWINAKKIPYFALKFFSTAHEIVIVGFDEEKKIVYYNDPVASVLGKKEEGIYASIPLEVFAHAVINSKIGKFNPKFIINTYKKNKSPQKKDLILKKSHDRNIEKMKGNPSTYDEKWKKHKLGFKALNEIIKDFEMVINNKKYDFLISFMMDSFKIDFLKKTSMIFAKKNSALVQNNVFTNLFDMVITEKKYAYEYLKKNSKNISGIDEEIDLLSQELEKWNLLSKFYSKFYKEVTMTKKSNKIKIDEKLLSIVSEIVDIEKKVCLI